MKGGSGGGDTGGRGGGAARRGLDALTDPEQLEEWFSADGEERGLVVEEVETGRRVAYTWEEGHVAIEVEKVGGGTRVVVTETGEPGWNAVFSLRSLAYSYA